MIFPKFDCRNKKTVPKIKGKSLSFRPRSRFRMTFRLSGCCAAGVKCQATGRDSRHRHREHDDCMRGAYLPYSILSLITHRGFAELKSVTQHEAEALPRRPGSNSDITKKL